MSPRMFASIISALAIVIGLLVLMTPTSIETRGTEVSCGNALSGVSRDAEMFDAGRSIVSGSTSAATDTCADKLSTRGWLGWTLLALGAVALVGALTVRTTAKR